MWTATVPAISKGAQDWRNVNEPGDSLSLRIVPCISPRFPPRTLLRVVRSISLNIHLDSRLRPALRIDPGGGLSPPLSMYLSNLINPALHLSLELCLRLATGHS